MHTSAAAYWCRQCSNEDLQLANHIHSESTFYKKKIMKQSTGVTTAFSRQAARICVMVGIRQVMITHLHTLLHLHLLLHLCSATTHLQILCMFLYCVMRLLAPSCIELTSPMKGDQQERRLKNRRSHLCLPNIPFGLGLLRCREQ